ncbi:MAG: hypothetical protein GY711_27940 [bacterium]|nr:hypothetical protein [bacterium]
MSSAKGIASPPGGITIDAGATSSWRRHALAVGVRAGPDGAPARVQEEQVPRVRDEVDFDPAPEQFEVVAVLPSSVSCSTAPTDRDPRPTTNVEWRNLGLMDLPITV